MNDYLRDRFSGPLAPYVDGLSAEFLTLAYAPSTVRSHLALWAQLSQWLESQGLDSSHLTAARIEAFLSVRRQTHNYLYTAMALSPGLDFLRRVGAVPEIETAVPDTAVAAIERQFRTYLMVERGLAEISAETYVVRARPFLVDRARRGPLDLESLTPADVRSFVTGWLPGLSKAPAKSTVTALRSLLSFLHATGVVASRWPRSSRRWRLGGWLGSPSD